MHINYSDINIDIFVAIVFHCDYVLKTLLWKWLQVLRPNIRGSSRISKGGGGGDLFKVEDKMPGNWKKPEKNKNHKMVIFFLL